MNDALLRTLLRDGADVAVVTLLAWFALRLLRRTRARPALFGLATLAGIYAIANQLGLGLTAAIFQASFAVLVVALVVVFQDDLRRFFEQIGSWGTRRGTPMRAPLVEDVLVRCVAKLARSHTGALIVIPGRDPLDRHIQGGIELGGQLSEPLLLSLFDEHSPGHDGAVILRGNVVERFSAHLPLSADHAQLAARGTRHAAALGLAERSDALCIVVSEERGRVSVASEGRLRELALPQELSAELHRRVSTAPDAEQPRRRWRDLALSAAVALTLWALLIPGSEVVQVAVKVPVGVENLPSEYALESVEPQEVEVTLSGRRRSLLLARGNVAVRIDALLVRLGRRTFELDASAVAHPEDVSVVGVTPARVRLSVTRGNAPAEPAP